MRAPGLPAWFAAALAVALVVAVDQAAADGKAPDEIVLKNGSRIVGEVTGARDGKVSIKTDFAGTLEVDIGQIESLATENPVVILLADESAPREAPLVIREEQLLLADGESQPLDELQVVNPEPWELGQGYQWTGTVGIAFKSERGNTDTDELDYDLKTVWRSTRDRYTLNAKGERDENNGEKTSDSWEVLGKYDFFLTDPNYIGLVGFVEQDQFRDLDLRYLVGPYLGRQFHDAPIFSLSGEFGFSYVNEQYDIADDDDYAASNWILDASSNYLGGDSKLYFRQIGVWNLQDTSDIIINTTFGLSFPLVWSLEAAVEMLLEYDSGAVEGVDDLDQTYRFRIGYAW